jgi:DNA-binding MarR family transcriptional regulator
MSHLPIYFDFLIQCEREQALIDRSCAHISPKLMALFLMLAHEAEQGSPLTVSGAMSQKQMASSAALHKRIDDLREAGMICVIYKGMDRRTKYLIPTDKGNRHLNLMGKLLQSSTRRKSTRNFSNYVL